MTRAIWFELYMDVMFWEKVDIDGAVPIHLDDLPLGRETKAALNRLFDWYLSFDDSHGLALNHPRRRLFESDAAETDAFDGERLRLWMIVREELGPGWTLGYYHGSRVLWDPADVLQ